MDGGFDVPELPPDDSPPYAGEPPPEPRMEDMADRAVPDSSTDDPSRGAPPFGSAMGRGEAADDEVYTDEDALPWEAREEQQPLWDGGDTVVVNDFFRLSSEGWLESTEEAFLADLETPDLDPDRLVPADVLVYIQQELARGPVEPLDEDTRTAMIRKALAD